jgi:hypothetical protein
LGEGIYFFSPFVEQFNETRYTLKPVEVAPNGTRNPAGVTGKDHANDYPKSRGIDDMLYVLVPEYGRNKLIKDDRSYGNSIRYD